MSQGDLFVAPPPVVPRTCGTCVTRNACNEEQELGDCSRTMRAMHRDEPACENWFGLEQLRRPLYGRKA